MTLSPTAQITVEVLDRVLDHPGVVAQCVGPYAGRFGFARGDGVALLDDLLRRAGQRDRATLVREGPAAIGRER